MCDSSWHVVTGNCERMICPVWGNCECVVRREVTLCDSRDAKIQELV